jgi:catechol 2,3-dioxygenase-like lactoylglutathione lyase family enzyme
VIKLNHVALCCSSEKRADGFYQGILGLDRIKTSVLSAELADRLFGLEMECPLLLYGNDQFQVEVFLTDPPQTSRPGFAHTCLEVHDRDAFIKKCEAMNVVINLVPKSDRLLLFVQDEDGNLFEIKEQMK